MMTSNAPSVYILTNKNKTVLYTGVTSNLEQRLHQHQEKFFNGFTKKYNVDILVYFEICTDMTEAIMREKSIKKKSRRGKVLLIESINPEWRDLQISR